MQPQGSNNKEKFIVELLKQGNQNAFDSLFREYGQRLYHFSYGYLKSREEAEEAVQETFIRVWESRSAIDSNQSFSGYIFTIAYRLILNRLRKIRNDHAGTLRWLRNRSKTTNETEDSIIYDDLGRLAKEAISALPPKRKAIYRMVREDHMTYQQVAENLNISVKTVESQMTEALKSLRKAITLPVYPLFTAFLVL